MTFNIQSYRLDRTLFEATAKRRIYRRFAWSIPLLVLILTLEFAFISKGAQGQVNVLPFAIPLAIFMVGLGMFRGFRAQLKSGKTVWDSYELTISDNILRRVTANLPPAEMFRTEVTRIIDAKGEGLTVATADRHRFIFVPEQVVGYGEVRERLASWRAFEPPRLARNRAVAVSWTIVLLGSWLASGMIPDIRLAMVAGVVLLAVGAVTMRETIKLTVMENKTKAAIFWGLCFMMLTPFARLLLFLAFHVNPRWPK